MSQKRNTTSSKNSSDFNLHSKPLWYSEGIQFQCQGSGKCCTSHGEYGFVFLTIEDRRRFAKYFQISTASFTKKYCDSLNGAYHLKEDPKDTDCMFLKNKKCSVYEARPTQCRTWPFWPEVMNAKTWKKEVVSFCPGIGKGPNRSFALIQKNLLEQEASEKLLVAEARKNSRST